MSSSKKAEAPPAATSSIAKKYRFIKEVGKGAYGTVWAAKDVVTDEDVAIKRIGARNFEENILTKRALRELKMLRHLNGMDNITTFIDAEINDTGDALNELYLVEGLMEADLSQIIKSNQVLTNQHYQYFVYQILRGLKYMHSANILHRDLKPGNLLVNGDCELRICDFGLARGMLDLTAQSPFVNTEYVATRWYRAPEVVLSPKHYSKAIDLWSVGCIFAELLQRKVFFKGTTYVDQLQKIFEVLGTPEDPTLTALCSSRVLKYLQSLPREPKKDLASFFPRGSDPAGLDLLEQLIIFDPAKRIDASQALAHPYLASYHHPDDEPVHPKIFDFSFETASTIAEMKVLIEEEVNAIKQAALQSRGGHGAAGAGGAPLAEAPLSPRVTNPPPEVDQKTLAAVPKDENIVAMGPTSVEEEINISDLKI
ncbi:hypothetical protein CXG81DRAFT_26947 [Caulochytrium protostelioides]|uniref:Mitogen-activated protein kinase n=1 Tax=Caulochytrium protostelioides TaxID=1555241 RepID=A0A4V1ITH5_9FUNG|nr:kinase-like protein [Caulochytrium protostelioides]RKP00359.1 hypothetical protein CXG81DRAFT_26947 [Caulochytrium protostelioides]|eukprot:RKP00359.1 hypothetical protein CXG81DRAFT_26947 [Caulochytrium protostelioides]